MKFYFGNHKNKGYSLRGLSSRDFLVNYKNTNLSRKRREELEKKFPSPNYETLRYLVLFDEEHGEPIIVFGSRRSNEVSLFEAYFKEEFVMNKNCLNMPFYDTCSMIGACIFRHTFAYHNNKIIGGGLCHLLALSSSTIVEITSKTEAFYTLSAEIGILFYGLSSKFGRVPINFFKENGSKIKDTMKKQIF